MGSDKVPEGCVPINSPFWPVEDVWPPGTLTEGCMMAYKLLNQRGEIEITAVRFNHKTLVTRVMYLSLEPVETERRRVLRQARQDALMLDDAAWVQTKV